MKIVTMTVLYRMHKDWNKTILSGLSLYCIHMCLLVMLDLYKYIIVWYLCNHGTQSWYIQSNFIAYIRQNTLVGLIANVCSIIYEQFLCLGN